MADADRGWDYNAWTSRPQGKTVRREPAPVAEQADPERDEPR